MSAVSEIGLKKALLFALGELEKGLLKISWLPPIRAGLLRLFGARIGKEAVIMNIDFINLHRTGFSGLRIGDHCFVGDGCLLDLADRIEIGNHSSLAQRVIVNTHLNVGFRSHPLQKRFPSFSKPVLIRENCFVGVGSILLAGSELESGCFVGAASLVNRKIAADSLVAGVPARPLREK